MTVTQLENRVAVLEKGLMAIWPKLAKHQSKMGKSDRLEELLSTLTHEEAIGSNQGVEDVASPSTVQKSFPPKGSNDAYLLAGSNEHLRPL